MGNRVNHQARGSYSRRVSSARYFQSMTGDSERCTVCHLPRMDHYNGSCPEECSECAMQASGQFMSASDHLSDCSKRNDNESEGTKERTENIG